MDLYRKGITGKLAKYAVRKYKSHCCIPEYVLSELNKIKLSITIVIDYDKKMHSHAICHIKSRDDLHSKFRTVRFIDDCHATILTYSTNMYELIAPKSD